NTGRSALNGLAVGLTVRGAPIHAREAIASAANPEGPQLERPVPGGEVPLGTVAAGRAAPFRIQVPVGRLRMTVHGVYPIGIEARSPAGRVGLTKTFLP